MDENDITMSMERASLLKDRWYLILKQGDDDDHVAMTAYDTTEDDEDDEYIPAGNVILSGLVELMENDFERVMQAGLARLAFEATRETMIEQTGNGADVTPLHETNIIRVDFGKKQ